MSKYEMSADGRNMLKELEGVEYEAYLDVAGVPTIGVGHTRKVYIGMPTASEHEVDTWLMEDLADAQGAVSNYVHVALNQNEADALISLVFNIGGTQFRNSTLLRKLNAGDRDGAAEQFLVWNKARVKGKLEEVKGLSKRRAVEKKLFEKPVAK